MLKLVANRVTIPRKVICSVSAKPHRRLASSWAVSTSSKPLTSITRSMCSSSTALRINAGLVYSSPLTGVLVYEKSSKFPSRLSSRVPAVDDAIASKSSVFDYRLPVVIPDDVFIRAPRGRPIRGTETPK